MRRYILFILLLFGFISNATAQTLPKKNDFKTLGGGMVSPKGGTMGNVIGAEPKGMDYGKYTDETLDEKTKEMQERDWQSEDTAWKRACSINNTAAYQRYSAIYPNGAHISEAQKRLIDLQVEEVINNDHGDLPNIKQLVKDDDSPISVVRIENHTNQTLTVMYSGLDSRKIRIPPYGRDKISVKNGRYGIAASVTSRNVKPFAGHTTLSGGEYEIGFYIVRE